MEKLLFTFLVNLLEKVKDKFDASQQFESPDWVLDDASFEKMGAMMASNNNKLLGIYDELGTFLSQINAVVEKIYLNPMNLPHFSHFTMLSHGNVQQVCSSQKFSVCTYAKTK